MRKPTRAAQQTLIIESIYPFFAIVSFNSFYATDCEAQIKRLRKRTKGKRLTKKQKIELSNLIGDARTSSIIAVVFAVTALEHAIYRYALRRLSHEFFVKHLDRLSLLAKWLVIPKLVTGKALEESDSAMSSLRELIATRNDLVYAKARVGDIASRKDADRMFKRSMQQEPTISKCAASAPKIVERVVRLLEKIDPCDDVSKIVHDTLQE